MAAPALRLPLPDLARQFLLRPDMTFLNHGSFGACPAPVFAAYQQWQRELEAQPVEFLGRRIAGLLAEARAALAMYVGCESSDDLTFVPNATHAINIVARSLDLQPGDEVLATDHEYGAVDRTWRFICGQRGAHYIRQPIALPLSDPAEVVAQLWAGVTPRTKVIVVSHITSPTALTFPVAAICARARAAGIISVIDGAHAPGQIALDMAALGADFYAGNCHKWLCAPKGAGFLYARRELQPLLQPLIVSWGWEAITPGPSPFVDHFGWTGTFDPAAYLTVPAAIAFQAAHDWDGVRAACHALLVAARDRVAALFDLPQICPAGPEWFSQLAVAPLPPCDTAALQRRLWDEHRIEIPIIQWEDRAFARISIQAYNTPEDVERLVAGLVNGLRAEG
jgi:isopenicillin-N epimerase